MFGSRKGLQSAHTEIKWVPEPQGTHTKYNITTYKYMAILQTLMSC